jgi:hypothetical protein
MSGQEPAYPGIWQDAEMRAQRAWLSRQNGGIFGGIPCCFAANPDTLSGYFGTGVFGVELELKWNWSGTPGNEPE